jgi:uncharacterized protein involved in tolerance to divalent cations
MIEYKCKRCGYTVKLIADYKKHLNRKNICKPLLEDVPIDVIPSKKKINKYECLNCSNTFAHSSSLYRHQKKCIIDNSPNNKIKSFEEQIKELTKKIKEMESKNNTNINTQNNNYNNTVININAYGTHTPSITYNELEKLLKIGARSAITRLIETNHFNKEKPENMNFYISNYKDNIGRVYDGETWIMKDGDELVNEIYDLYQSLVDNLIEDITYYSEDETEQQNFKAKLLDKINDTIDTWCKRTNNNKFIDGLKEDLKKHFYSKKAVVKKVHNIKGS